MSREGMRPLRIIRRRSAVVALGWLALVIACGKDEVAPVAVGPRDLNVRPVAQFQVAGGCATEAASLDASASSDPDGVIRLYEWDFESDGTIDTSGAVLSIVQHRYAPGSHRAKLVVTDDAGGYSVAVQSFSSVTADTLYVSSSTGTPSGPGTRASPFARLSSAIEAVGSRPCPTVILLATGFYPEAPALQSRLRIRGGYNPADWTHRAGMQTEIGGSPSTAFQVHDTEVSDVVFLANDISNRGLSAIAFVATECDASLRFVHCAFVAGNAGMGTDGVSQAGPGYAGEDGQVGALGGRGGGALASAENAGGGGGTRNWAGGDGRSSGCSGVGTGGLAGSNSVTNGADGGDGSDGAAGANGSGVLTDGSFNGGTWSWVPGVSRAGEYGCSGGGGGGGGGGWTAGGCPTDWSGTGGGGGQGGVGGKPGSGGLGGGASIALALIHASPRFEDCRFASGHGGDGGLGGSGQAGAFGGAGGPGASSSCGTRGGNGGRGGASGPGGGGQGGAGGPSWCILRFGSSSPELVNPVYAVGIGGLGGAGGRQGGSGPSAPNGPDGPAAIQGP